MKKITSFIILILIASSVFANDQKIITVLDFETSGVSEQEMILFIDYLSSSVSDYKEYKLIDRRQRETILAEAQFSNSGCADESCAIEIGQLLSANEMIVGSIGSIGTLYLLNLKLIDAETGEILKNSSQDYSSLEELVRGSDEVITILFFNDNNSDHELKIETTRMDINNSIKNNVSTTEIPVFSEPYFQLQLEPVEIILEKNVENQETPGALSINYMFEEEKKIHVQNNPKEAENLNLSLKMYDRLLTNNLKSTFMWPMLIGGSAMTITSLFLQDLVISAALSITGGLSLIAGILIGFSSEPVYDLDGNVYKPN